MAEVQKIKISKKQKRKKAMAKAEEDAKKAIAEAEEGANKSMAESEEGAKKSMAESEEGAKKSMAESEEGAKKSMEESEEGAKKSMAEAEEEGAPSFERSIDTPHPSEHSWTFLFDDPSSRSNKKSSTTWGSNIQPIHSFSTLEEFWCLYSDNLHPPKLAVGANFYCFKYKIMPYWEDPVCANGGKWTISCARGKSDTWWLHTLLAMIREQFDYGDEICGAAVYVRRKQERISLWTKNASNEATQIIIGKQWKEFMDYNDTIGFTFHDDAKKKRNQDVKNRYVI